MPEPHLERQLGLFPVTNIVIANMIGAGIFTTSGLLMRDLQNPLLMLILWLVGGAIALCGALNYGELGAAFPKAGGEYAFLKELYNPLLGFLSGWVSLIAGFSAPIAASAIGFSEYLLRAFPMLHSLTGGLPEQWLNRIISISVILLFTGVHLRGLRFGTQIQNALTLLKVLLIAGLIVIGFTAGQGSWHHLRTSTHYTFDLAGWKTIGLSLMWILFAYSGWNAATYIGAEIKKPKRNLPLSLLIGTAAVTVLYFALNLFYVYALPPGEMAGVISISGLAVAEAFGRAMESTISVMIAFALFSSLSAFLILGPRVYYAMARDGLFFSGLSQVNSRFHVPAKSIMLQGGIACLLVVTGTFDQILTYMGFSLGLFPLLSVLGVFKLRAAGKSVLPLPGFPFTGMVYLIAGIAILALAYLERPLESTLALLTVAAGAPVFYFFKKSRQTGSL